MKLSRLDLSSQLSKFAQSNDRRQKLLAINFTGVGGALLLGATVSNYFLNSGLSTLTFVLLFFTIAFAITLWLLVHSFKHGLYSINLIVLALAYSLFYTGGHEGTALMWTYPIIIVFLYMNKFKAALFFISTYIFAVTTSLAAPNISDGIHMYDDGVVIRYLITLSALSAASLINTYFHDSAHHYIKFMYKNDIVSLMNVDPLTGLANRIAFKEYFSNEVSNSSSDTISAIVYFDLDNFKGINDNNGHLAGDKALKAYSERLWSWANQVSVATPNKLSVCRYGGDEFVCYIKAISSNSFFEESLSHAQSKTSTRLSNAFI